MTSMRCMRGASLCLILILSTLAQANWSETFDNNAFDLSTWLLRAYPELTGTSSATIEMVDEAGEADEPISIVTAVPKYKLTALLEHEAERVAVSIFGAAGPRNDGRILALLEVEILFGDDAAGTELAVECGVLLEPGEAQEVARWGKRALVVHAEYAD